jgi:hypothetical protein
MAGPSIDVILNAVYLASFVAFFVYGLRIQTWVMLFGVRRKLTRVEWFRNTAHSRLLQLMSPYTVNKAEGTGAAIGGSGTERYHIEEAAAKSNIVLDAVIVKMSSKEAISTLTPELQEAAAAAYNRIRTIIQSEPATGDTVIIPGIGNTIGIE